MKKVDFVLREMGEVHGLEFLIKSFCDRGITWNVYLSPYNTDFEYCNPRLTLSDPTVNFVNGKAPSSAFGFVSDISEKVKDKARDLIDIYTLSTCMSVGRRIRLPHEEKIVVVSNVKINDKNPHKEYDPYMWEVLRKLPYKVIVAPRHPIPEDYFNGYELPPNVTIHNSVGQLKSLMARANLVIMGLIFSNPENQSDHSPIEATQNSNAIYGSDLCREDAYCQYYSQFDLLHPSGFQEDFSELATELIEDPELDKKLNDRDEWILSQRGLHLPRIYSALTT